MPTINIKVTLITPEDKLEGNYKAILDPEQDIVIYQEADKTITKIDYKEKVLKRENNEIRMYYSFIENKKTKGIIEIKKLKKELELNIKTKKIIQHKNNIEIIYDLEKASYRYKIEVI